MKEKALKSSHVSHINIHGTLYGGRPLGDCIIKYLSVIAAVNEARFLKDHPGGFSPKKDFSLDSIVAVPGSPSEPEIEKSNGDYWNTS